MDGYRMCVNPGVSGLRFAVSLSTAFVLLLLFPAVSGGQIWIEPISYEWGAEGAPPWQVKIEQCRVDEMVRAMYLVVRKEEGFSGAYYFLESSLSQWNYFRILVTGCSFRVRKKIEGPLSGADASYDFADIPALKLSVATASGRKETITLHVVFQVSLRHNFDKEESLAFFQGRPVSFGGIMEVYSADPVAHAMTEIHTLFITVFTWTMLVSTDDHHLASSGWPRPFIFFPLPSRIPVAEVLRDREIRSGASGLLSDKFFWT